MRRVFLLILAAAVILSAGMAYASDAGNEKDLQNSETVTLVQEETYTADKICDVTWLNCVADDIAMSIPAYHRDDNEKVHTPETKALNGNTWNDRNRYKYKKNGESNSYADMYVAIGAAVKPQSDEYMLLDIRLDILNRAITPLKLDERVKAVLKYADGYEFELTCIKTEVTDTIGNKNEWLSDNLEIPVLVSKVVHLIFEVPNIVAESTEPLTADVEICDLPFHIVIR